MSYDRRGPGQGWQSGQDDQRRRMAALRNLAEQANQPRDANGLVTTQPRMRAAPPRERRNPQRRNPQALRGAVQRPQPLGRRGARPIILIMVIALVVALVAGAGVWALKSGRLGRAGGAASQPAMPAVQTIDLSAYNISCPTDPVWAPDGTRIAVLATLGDCGNQQTAGPTLAIFDARTGKLTQSYTLNAILAKQGIPTALSPSPAVWSPDGSSLYVAVGYVPYQIVPAGTPHGLISLSLASGAVRFTADATPRPQSQDGSNLNSATLIWDTKLGKLAHTITELAPATAYAWSADGSLSPAPADATGRGVVSVWQSGIIDPVYAAAWNNDYNPPADQVVPQTYIFDSTTPRWSPDGRYLALPLSMAVRLPGGPNAYPTVGCAPVVCQSAPVAPPDKAFSVAFAAFQKGWSPQPQQPPFWNSQDVAWRADGQELATLLPGQDFNTQNSTATVTIFNTKTGAVVKTLTVRRIVGNYLGSGDLPQIAWSPRGASLAALDYGDATLTLWRAE